MARYVNKLDGEYKKELRIIFIFLVWIMNKWMVFFSEMEEIRGEIGLGRKNKSFILDM